MARSKNNKNLTDDERKDKCRKALDAQGFIYLSMYYPLIGAGSNYRSLKILCCCKKHPEMVKCVNYTSVVGKGLSPCRKCHTVKLSEVYLPKYEKKVIKLCKTQGLTFLGFGEYQGSDTRLLLRCDECGSEITPTYEAFSLRKTTQTRGCGSCKIKHAHYLKSDKQAIKYLSRFKNVPDGFKITRNLTDGSKWDCWCPVCAKDEYSVAGIGTGNFTVQNSSMFQNKLPCRCGDNKSLYRLTDEQKIYKLKQLCTDTGVTFISLSGDGKKIKWKCQKGHTRVSQIYRFVMGQRCRKCHYSFREWAYLYVVRWYSNDGSINFIKFGITGLRKWMKRVYRQKQKSGLNYEILHVFRGSGACVFDTEKILKQGKVTDLKVVAKGVFPDGFTETFNVDDLDKVLEVLNNSNLLDIYSNNKLNNRITRTNNHSVESLLAKLEKYGIHDQILSSEQKEDLTIMYIKQELKKK